jgi:hypothetical protein
MSTSEWIAVIALVISSGGFALQARSWLVSGPRLYLSVIADAVSFPVDDEKPKLALTVINRGDEPTMLTHMVGFIYRSRWRRFRRNPDYAGVVNSTSIPAKLEINGTWMGLMTYDRKTADGRAKGHLYVGVIASHANGEFLIRVPPKRERNIPKEKIAAS